MIISTMDYSRPGDRFGSFPPLDHGKILHIYDIFTEVEVQELIARYGKPSLIISDHFTQLDLGVDVDFKGLPLFFESQIQECQKSTLDKNTYESKWNFNFIVNKKQVNRYLLIKFVEMFGLENYQYTFSGIGRQFDCSEIIAELDSIKNTNLLSSNQKTTLLAPIMLRENFIKFDHSSVKAENAVTDYGGVAWAWNNGLHELFSGSSVSLISESIAYQKGSVFTEKTLFALMGLTFPIWVGGYKQADSFAQMGFDIFDDIINHKYQNYDTLIERCYHAFADNIELLKDAELSKALRVKNMNRLLSNKQKLFDGSLHAFIDKELRSLGNERYDEVKDFFNKKFRRNLLKST